MEKVYLDYAASTPVDPAVEKAMKPYFGKIFGNPNALHGFGQEASRAVFAARRKIAESIGADYKQIIFTGSATEANNLALQGVARGYRIQNSEFRKKAISKFPYSKSYILNPRIIVSAIEHDSILETCKDLAKDGVEIVYIPVNREGIVDLKKLESALNERTVLVSVMYANNEIGTIQPIREISRIINNFYSMMKPLFHTDAVQAFQYLNCNVNDLGVDLMTLSAHKIYGPKGIGALYVRDPKALKPIITGTDNVPYIVGFAKAAEIADRMCEKESKRTAGLRNYFWAKLHKTLPKLELNGSMRNRSPNNLNVYFPGQNAHELQIKLDLAGVAASPGAACTTRISRSSFVLEEMGFSKERASGSLRFSLGRQTAKKDLDYVTSVLIKLLK